MEKADKAAFVKRFRKLLPVTIIGKGKLIDKLKDRKAEEVNIASIDFNKGLDAAIEIINKYG